MGSHPPSIQVQYHITPIPGIDTSSVSLPSEQSIITPIPKWNVGSYQNLSMAVAQAQKSLNDALTVWKEAIGDVERVKESAEKGRRQVLGGSEQASEVVESSSEGEE